MSTKCKIGALETNNLLTNTDMTSRQEPGLSLGLRQASERRRYKVTPSLIGWAQT